MPIISVSTRKITRLLCFTILGLSSINVIVQFIKYSIPYNEFSKFIYIFDVDHDNSIPTWYSSFALIIAALLLGLIAAVKVRSGDHFFRYWTGLFIIFTFMSIDEVVMIHERAGDVLTALLPHCSGFFHYAWVLFGIPLTLIFVLVYLRFLLHLPSKTAYQFLLAGAIFVAGALGMEMFAARYDSLYGNENLMFNLITAVEEYLEMLGVIVFIHTLLSYINTQLKGIQLIIGKEI